MIGQKLLCNHPTDLRHGTVVAVEGSHLRVKWSSGTETKIAQTNVNTPQKRGFRIVSEAELEAELEARQSLRFASKQNKAPETPAPVKAVEEIVDLKRKSCEHCSMDCARPIPIKVGCRTKECCSKCVAALRAGSRRAS